MCVWYLTYAESYWHARILYISGMLCLNFTNLSDLPFPIEIICGKRLKWMAI